MRKILLFSKMREITELFKKMRYYKKYYVHTHTHTHIYIYTYLSKLLLFIRIKII